MFNLSVFLFYVQNGMLCTKYIIVLSLENSFPIMLSGEVQCPPRWLGHYIAPDNTIGEQGPQKQTIIEQMRGSIYQWQGIKIPYDTGTHTFPGTFNKYIYIFIRFSDFHIRPKKIICVFTVGRSGLIFFFLNIDKTGNSRSRFQNPIPVFHFQNIW